MPRLNYTPDKAFPLTISKTTAHWFIYEQDEPEPVISKRFKTAEAAQIFAIITFPGYRIIMEN